MNQRIWKELSTSQNKSLSAFSLSPHVQVLQMLARFFIKFIHWPLNKFSIELNRKLVQSSANWFYYCAVKELLFSEDFFINDLIDRSIQSDTIDFTATRLCKACGRPVLQMQGFGFLRKLDQLRFLHKNSCQETFKYFVSFKLKSLKSNRFRQNIILSNHWPPTNKLFDRLIFNAWN